MQYHFDQSIVMLNLGLWKSTISVKDDFDLFIFYRAHNGQHVSF